MKFEPDVLTFRDGRKVNGPADWEARRAELLDILAHEEYGYMPPLPKQVKGEVLSVDEKHCSGHAALREIKISFDTPKGEFSFPMRLVLPVGEGPHPVFVFLNFRPNVYDMYLPLEEVTDNGFGVADIYYQDVSSDDDDMTNGLTGMFDRPDDGAGYGKITIWAYAVSRAIDYLVTLPEIDQDNLTVIGHSRLGKTALWCGANDTRVKFTVSNCSGCGGAAYERTKKPGAETIEVMNRVFPYWFCENRQKYAGHESEMPFDQHFLLAALAPRYVSVSSAEKDDWADQQSEQRSCLGATPAWQVNGLQGFVGPEEPVAVGDCCEDGEISYHLRDGVHFLGRFDWQCYMRFVKKNRRT